MALNTWRPKKSSKPTDSTPQQQSDYRSVAINCGTRACEAAKRVQGQRFLLQFVHLFKLPLPECDINTCRCSYQHFEDRRVEERRLGGISSSFKDRRSGDDRRKNSPPSPRPKAQIG